MDTQPHTATLTPKEKALVLSGLCPKCGQYELYDKGGKLYCEIFYEWSDDDPPCDFYTSIAWIVDQIDEWTPQNNPFTLPPLIPKQ